MFKIGAFSKLTNVTVRTLRHYEEINLIMPDFVDEKTGYRYYDYRQIEKVNTVRMLQSAGLSLRSIQLVLEDHRDLEHYYQVHLQLLQQEQELLNRKVKALQLLIDKREQGLNYEKYNVVKKTLPARHVISLRKRVKTYSDESTLWKELFNTIERSHLTLAQEPMALAIFHDKEYKENNVDIEVQVSVTETNHPKVEETEELTIASVLFKGPYTQMVDVTEALAAWIDHNNYEISGPMFNHYIVSPSQTPDSDEWITESAYLIEKQ